MSVVIETTIGDITVDLYLKERPKACLNFLKLCKVKYYNLCVFHRVETNFIAQTGDPTGTGRGGESVFSRLYGDQAAFFDAELKPRLKHEKMGTLSMVNNGNNMNGSQFFLTLGENLSYLDEVHTVFGEVAEGFDVLSKINEAICDPSHRPYQDIRITHTVVLHDPYDDPSGLEIPDASPVPTREMLESNYIGADEEIDDTKGKNAEEIEEKIKDSEAKARATILEMVGDLPDVDVKPPENVLFVCKLNPVTTSEDLEVIFSRFGKIVSCEVIKDKVSGESLQYAFIEFENEDDCENAYFKMDNVLIDDRRIHVDFSQSVSKLNKNSFPKDRESRNRTFSIKDRAKKPDGYEMIFDMEESSSVSKPEKYPRKHSPEKGKKKHSEYHKKPDDRNHGYSRSYHVDNKKVLKYSGDPKQEYSKSSYTDQEKRNKYSEDYEQKYSRSDYTQNKHTSHRARCDSRESNRSKMSNKSSSSHNISRSHQNSQSHSTKKTHRSDDYSSESMVHAKSRNRKQHSPSKVVISKSKHESQSPRNYMHQRKRESEVDKKYRDKSMSSKSSSLDHSRILKSKKLHKRNQESSHSQSSNESDSSADQEVMSHRSRNKSKQESSASHRKKYEMTQENRYDGQNEKNNKSESRHQRHDSMSSNQSESSNNPVPKNKRNEISRSNDRLSSTSKL